MQTEIDPRDLIGHKAVDKNGEKIGTVDEVYLDDATGQPEWAAVRTGLFGRDAFVPLTTSEFISDELRVPYEKALVKDSPDFGVGQHLSPAQELQLYRYYGLEVPTGTGQHAAEPGVRAGGKPTTPTAGSNGSPTASPAVPPGGARTDAPSTPGLPGTAGAPGAAAGMAAGSATAERREKTEHAQAAEHNLTTPTVQPLAHAGRTSSFLTGTAPNGNASPQQAAAVSPAGAGLSAPGTSAAQTSLAQTSAPQTSTPQMSTPQTSTPAPFAGNGSAPGAVEASAAGAQRHSDRLIDPLTDPLPGLGLPASPTGSKDAVPEPLEILCREERLDISTEWHVLGRARLRKYVTSEQVERRVPVVRERIRVERVPVGAEERAQLTDAEIAESVEEVILHEERLVVKKTVVPVERIRLVTERFTEEEVVREQLHREHVQVQDGSKPAGTPVAPAGAAANGAGCSAGPDASPTEPSRTQPSGTRFATAASGTAPLRPPATMGPGRNPDLPDHAMGA